MDSSVVVLKARTSPPLLTPWTTPQRPAVWEVDDAHEVVVAKAEEQALD